MKFKFTISEEIQLARLDHLVARHVESCSRPMAAALIKSGVIRVGGIRKKPGYKTKPGELVTGIIEKASRQVTAPESLDLDILYEDDHIIVLNKAAGEVVHPAPGHESGTLVNALLNHCRDLYALDGPALRNGIVHRLDKDTSGVIVMAKKARALTFLQTEFKQRRVAKNYLALALGTIKEDQGEIDLPIGRHAVKRKMMSVNSPTARHAITQWAVLERFENCSLMDVRLKTGRTHQIRVHFKALGHPLVGDSVYGFRKKRKKRHRPGLALGNLAKRQMLHAWKLGFRHPRTGQRVQFKAPLPKDFRDLLKGLESKSVATF